MAERVVILVRHGEPAYDPVLADEAGSPDGPLSDRGRAQVCALAERLHGRRIDRLYSSTLHRALDTARLIGEHLELPVREADVLREVIPNVPPDDVLSEQQRRFLAPEAWPPGHLDRSAERARTQLAEFAGDPTQDGVDLLVTHGNVIAGFVSHAIGGPSWAWLSLASHDHAAISAILYRTGRPPTVLTYNDAGHLPAGLRGVGLPPTWSV